MNPNFMTIINASHDERRDLFLTTANRLGTTLQNIEKDFWVCWVLDLLFNGKQDGEPRLLFKGGTSLSKAYGLISRFSEDIDITVFREDLGIDLAINCAHHAEIFFYRPDYGLHLARPGSFKLAPTPKMMNVLKQDYQAMTSMIFGDIPNFDDVIQTILEFEKENNLSITTS